MDREEWRGERWKEGSGEVSMVVRAHVRVDVYGDRKMVCILTAHVR